MISLVLAQIWTRRGQAVTLALLALFAVASAVASPAYLAAADRAVAAGQIATASPAERTLSISASENKRQGESIDFGKVGSALITLPGFSYVYSEEIHNLGIDPDTRNATRLVYREDVCAHLHVVTGRCLAGAGEVMIGKTAAQQRHIVAGQRIKITAAIFNNSQTDPRYVPDGDPKVLTVAGIYTVPHQSDPYWGLHGYFTVVPQLSTGEPLFVSASTLTAIDHGVSTVAIDGTAGSGALGVDHLGELRDGLTHLQATTAELGSSLQVTTSIGDLLDRIDDGQAAAHVLVPVLAVPLVLLACFTIFLAVGYGSQGRQPELAVVALRGNRWWVRWWLATGESLIAIVAGAIFGCVAGQLLVDAIAAARFPGVGVAADWGSLKYAPIAAVAALLAAVFAQRRQLSSPVATLLRRNPVAAAGFRVLAADLLIVLLAVISAAQLIISGGSLTGIGVLAPAFVILALAMLAARAVLPVVTGYATRALRRGRIGVALAGLQLSRRPGAQRLFALLTATVAVAVYATGAVNVADQGRAIQAGVGTGAPRVLTIQTAYRSQLLYAVRKIDPAGKFAMAVDKLHTLNSDEPPGLAMDTTRLAAVANWPSGGLSAAAVAAKLRPGGKPAAPITFAGQNIEITATGSGFTFGKELSLGVDVSSTTNGGDQVVGFGQLKNGSYTYVQEVDACIGGCRLNGIQILSGNAVVGVTGQVVITAMGTTAPTTQAVTAAQLGNAAGWRHQVTTKVSAAGGGLQINVDAPSGLPGGTWVKPALTPDPLPAAYSGSKAVNSSVTGLDGEPQKVDYVARIPAVPVLGDHATLVDLEYADRLAIDGSQALQPQVWLNDKAPADIVELLSAQGLNVLKDTEAAQIQAQLNKQGPALSLMFYLLAGVLAVMLGAGALVLAAAVDRTRRVEDLSALRGQGLRRPMVNRATMWTYPVLVAIAAVAGLVIAELTWAITGWALPLTGLAKSTLPLPLVPSAIVLLGTVVVVFLALALVAVITGHDLRKRIDATRREAPPARPEPRLLVGAGVAEAGQNTQNVESGRGEDA